MGLDRLTLLKQMVAARPTDPFPKYGLAMELRGRGDANEAREVFAALLQAHPGYVPAYLMSGQHLAATGFVPEAIDVFERGIEVAEAAGDEHAAGELAAARAALGER